MFAWIAVQNAGCGSAAKDPAASGGNSETEGGSGGIAAGTTGGGGDGGSRSSGGSSGGSVGIAGSGGPGGSSGSGGSGGTTTSTGGTSGAERDASVTPDSAPATNGLDGGGSEAPPGGGGAHGCTSGVAFCDDFESYMGGGAPGGKWKFTSMPSDGFSIAVDSMHAFSGTKAVHVSVKYAPAGDAHRGVYIGADHGVAGNAVYTRFMMYQTQWMRGAGSIHGRVLQMGKYAFEFNFTPTTYAMEVINDNFGKNAHMGPAPILDKWICVQAQFGPQLALKVDGKDFDAPAGGGGATTLQLGMDTWRTLTTDFWIDDLVVDSKPIPCP